MTAVLTILIGEAFVTATLDIKLSKYLLHSELVVPQTLNRNQNALKPNLLGVLLPN